MDTLLTVAIATTQARYAGARLTLPILKEVKYLVICQIGSDGVRCTFQFEDRGDVTEVFIPGVGAARSRNAAIKLIPNGWLLFGDDDVLLSREGLEKLVRMIQAGPEVDLLAMIIVRPNSSAPRPNLERFTRWNVGRIGTPELAIDVEKIRSRQIRFDERFGAGNHWHLGDELIFVTDCLKRGLAGEYRDVVLGVHPEESSGSNFDRSSLRIRGKVLRRAYGNPAPVIALALWWRNRRKIHSLADGLSLVISASRTIEDDVHSRTDAPTSGEMERKP